MACCQDILAIPAKKQARPAVSHLTVEQTRRLLAQPDRSTRRGRRDATLLATLYDTAARVQELADLTVRDIRLQHPAMAVADRQGPQDPPRPPGRQHDSAAGRLPGRTPPGPSPATTTTRCSSTSTGAKLSRGGIAWIIRKYQAKTDDPPLAGTEHQPTHPAPQQGHAPLRGRRPAALHPRHPRPRRPVHHRDLRARLDRGETQSPRSRLPRHRHRATCPNGTRTPDCSTGSPAFDPSPEIMRSARPPDRPLTRPQQAGTAHNPALRIGRGGVSRPVATSICTGWTSSSRQF